MCLSQQRHDTRLGSPQSSSPALGPRAGSPWPGPPRRPLLQCTNSGSRSLLIAAGGHRAATAPCRPWRLPPALRLQAARGTHRPEAAPRKGRRPQCACSKARQAQCWRIPQPTVWLPRTAAVGGAMSDERLQCKKMLMSRSAACSARLAGSGVGWLPRRLKPPRFSISSQGRDLSPRLCNWVRGCLPSGSHDRGMRA